MYKLENGETLSKYCRKNGSPYACLWDRVAVKGMSPEKAIKDYIDSKGKPKRCSWYYHGETLRSYCLKNNLPYQKIVNYYYRNNKYNKINPKPCTMDEAVEIFKNL